MPSVMCTDGMHDQLFVCDAWPIRWRLCTVALQLFMNKHFLLWRRWSISDRVFIALAQIFIYSLLHHTSVDWLPEKWGLKMDVSDVYYCTKKELEIKRWDDRKTIFKLLDCHGLITSSNDDGYGRENCSHDWNCAANENLDVPGAFHHLPILAAFYNQSKSSFSKVAPDGVGSMNILLDSLWLYPD